jgi:hypothetical protein
MVPNRQVDLGPIEMENTFRKTVSDSRTHSTDFRYHLHLRRFWRDFMDSILSLTRNLTDNHV